MFEKKVLKRFEEKLDKFIAEQAMQSVVIGEFRNEIARLRQMNEKLLDRLMAKDFQTLKEYTLPEDVYLQDTLDKSTDEEELIGTTGD